MSPKVLRRFIFFMLLLTIGMFVFWDVIGSYVRRAPGDFQTEMGTNRLNDELYDEALSHFDQALAEQPDHRGALMGRALVFIQTERYDEALGELGYLIEYLERTLEPDDPTGRGVLAAAHANRGIVLDRQGAYENALEAYIEALKIDSGAVEGPGIVHKILYGSDSVSSVRDRAVYLHEQLQLPESERVLRIPELDEKQRMHKP
ncbi:MAG: tetratricopeptide repeat protein [Alphaproteobacteria bacterium]|nr:tetratricopeptide repeat protein [Alphaproteobacteria bacterium]